LRTFIIGAGKVGHALARALKQGGYPVTLRPLRRGMPQRRLQADLVVLAVRDPVIPSVAVALARSGQVLRTAAVIHVSGGLSPDALAPLRDVTAGLGQAHPLLSFASAGAPPTLEGALLWIRGDRSAVARCRALARLLGMRARAWPDLDASLYHAAAGLLANGSAALAAGAARLLESAGVPGDEAARALGPLLHSVATNVEHLGLPAALTGPIRRGDADAIRAHLTRIGQVAPDLLPLYRACARAQVPLARALGDAPVEALDRVERTLSRRAKRLAPRR
jgi:predicted short-subunit dehydrogenase-like oxidoreductase (DUF2520 family)